MKDTPILYSGPMVRAWFAGRKSQTRRVMKVQPERKDDTEEDGRFYFPGPDGFKGLLAGGLEELLKLCPYGGVGDRLWGRETWMPGWDEQLGTGVNFAADSGFLKPSSWTPDQGAWCQNEVDTPTRWRPSIHMPRWASRITQEIVELRAERVSDISAEDAIAEGIEPVAQLGILRCAGWKDYSGLGAGWIHPQDSYRSLWNLINLEPSPVQGRGPDGKKVVLSYVAYPWCAEDFEARYPGVMEAKVYRGKPIEVVPDPWVWVVGFTAYGGDSRLPDSRHQT